MVRRTRAEQHESVPQPVISVANEYPAGYEHPAHRHQRSQFLFAEYGTMLVDTEGTVWIGTWGGGLNLLDPYQVGS